MKSVQCLVIAASVFAAIVRGGAAAQDASAASSDKVTSATETSPSMLLSPASFTDASVTARPVSSVSSVFDSVGVDGKPEGYDDADDYHGNKHRKKDYDYGYKDYDRYGFGRKSVYDYSGSGGYDGVLVHYGNSGYPGIGGFIGLGYYGVGLYGLGFSGLGYVGSVYYGPGYYCLGYYSQCFSYSDVGPGFFGVRGFGSNYFGSLGGFSYGGSDTTAGFGSAGVNTGGYVGSGNGGGVFNTGGYSGGSSGSVGFVPGFQSGVGGATGVGDSTAGLSV
ncbi:hypothetical protein Gpo141_00010728 [Globisporangium polare]